ncbi:MAG: T9SS type A sorting domain-containing protein [Tannerella sp.]|nr:T9SS type A sorting domain-containing protein [Tannerella sp.]
MEDLLLPDSVTDKTQFTDGTGIATYKYIVDITPLLEKYSLVQTSNTDTIVKDRIEYDIWVAEEVSNNPGSGNAYPTISRAVKILAEEGLATYPYAGIPQYVNIYKDFTFEVSGDPEKTLEAGVYLDPQLDGNLIVDPVYAIDKGIKIEATAAGKWNVTISKVFHNITVKVGYAATTESNEGGDGTGNLLIVKDAVWASGGQLYIKAATPGQLQIYSITGQLQKAKAVSGNVTLSDLPKGIYLVKLNGRTYKVFN